jgi:hypothetical protein
MGKKKINLSKPYRYLIVFEVGPRQHRRGSAIHTFYAPNRKTADRYARDWARRRHATKITHLSDRRK